MGTVSEELQLPPKPSIVEKWIVEAQEGNREALGRLLDICRPYLLLIANRKLTSVLQVKVSSSDIVQETLMLAGRDFQRFHGATEKELLAWLKGILRNRVARVKRYFNSDKRRLSREIPLADTPFDRLQSSEHDHQETPSGVALARELDQQLETAIQQLPPHYRQVIQLQMIDGLTFVQIAEKLGTTAEAARKLWGRAVDKLSDHLYTR